jgi:hypothetical protein
MCQQVYGLPLRGASMYIGYLGYLSEVGVPEVYRIPLRDASRYMGYLSVMPAGMGYLSDVPAGI